MNNPYSMDEDCWCDNMTEWPELLFGDVYTYLINTKGPLIKEKLKVYKSLDAYNYALEWLHTNSVTSSFWKS